MTNQIDSDLLNTVLQLLTSQGSAGFAEGLRLLVNEAMVQELRKPSGISQRTVCTSYLSSESGTSLSVGSHTVEAWGMANGTFKSFRHLCIHRETILVWFD
jgi:hypothetical protein